MSANPLSMTIVRRLLPAALVLPFAACDWFTDFKDQPRLEPWESYALADADSVTRARTAPRGQPQMSVPVTGSTAPGFWVSYTPGIAQLDSMSGLANPNAPTPESLENGRKHYQINCAVCHGLDGSSGGPVTLYGLPVPALTTPQAQGYSDGYLWGIIRNGRGLMPNYNRIEDADRWDVVNYMRGLQGRHAVEIGTPPTPGVTGDSVPRHTISAPTRPAPYFRPQGSSMTDSARAATGAAMPQTAPAAAAGDSVRPDSATQPGGRN